MAIELTDVLQREHEDLSSQIIIVEKEIQRVRTETEEEIASLEERREQLLAKIRHIQALLTLEGVPMKDAEQAASTGGTGGGAFGGSVSLADAVHQLLSQTAKEMHYSEIVNVLKARNIHVPGQNPGINLVAHIHDDPRFLRPRRGVYGLKEWYPKGVKSMGVKKQRRKRAGMRRS